MSHYFSDSLEKHAQRFIRPIYIKDELGHYKYSSTMTLLEYNGLYFGSIAYHALIKDNSLFNIYLLFNDGKFVELDKLFYKSIFSKEDDVVIGYFGDTKEPTLNFFQLNDIENTDPKFCFWWFGYPLKKAHKSYRKNISNNEIVEKFIETSDTGVKRLNNKYYGICINSKENDDPKKVLGTFINKDLVLKRQGNVTTGISLKGMSGGALFSIKHYKLAEKLSFEELSKDLNKFFLFNGIGLEHSARDNIIKGCSSMRIYELIDENLSLFLKLT